MDALRQFFQFLLTNPWFAWIFLVVWVSLLVILLFALLKKGNRQKNVFDFHTTQTQVNGFIESNLSAEKENEYWRINSIGDLLEILLKKVNVLNPNSIRILKKEIALGKMNCLGQFGNKSEKYAYLDEQICSLLESENRILNPDIRKIPQVKLQNGCDFPSAIYAFAIRNKNQLIGALWIGFQNSKQLTEQEVGYIQEWVDKISINFEHWMIWDELNLKNRMLLKCLNELNIPVLVIDHEDVVLFCNPPMTNVDAMAMNWIGYKISELKISESTLNVFDSKFEVDKKKVKVIGVENRIFHVNKFLISDVDKFKKLFTFKEISEEEKREKILKENIAFLTHDLKSPLSLVRGYTTMLPVVGDFNEQQDEYAKNILQNIDELINLIKNLLWIERLEMGEGLIIENMELISVVKKVIDSLLPFAHQKQIQINQQYNQGTPISMQGDTTLIERAIYNIVDNAIKFTPLKGEVIIKIIEKNDSVELQISDNGIGIAEVDLPHIFEKFYRMKTNPQETKSESGIGLVLVRLIIEKHFGTIEVKSSLGKGSTFIIKLPKQQKIYENM